MCTATGRCACRGEAAIVNCSDGCEAGRSLSNGRPDPGGAIIEPTPFSHPQLQAELGHSHASTVPGHRLGRIDGGASPPAHPTLASENGVCVWIRLGYPLHSQSAPGARKPACPDQATKVSQRADQVRTHRFAKGQGFGSATKQPDV